MKILDLQGNSIVSLDQWTRPNKDFQWREGRSAMELARAWCAPSGPACPAGIASLLHSHALTRDLVIEEVRPEFVTPLPERGVGRNHDLWARCVAGSKPFTLCVEAKADEPFGETVAETCASALRRSENTGGVRRASTLLKMIFGSAAEPDQLPYSALRYQLLTALAGTALQAIADGSRLAALVIHEFRSSLTAKPNLERNASDLDAFLLALNGGRPVSL